MGKGQKREIAQGDYIPKR